MKTVVDRWEGGEPLYNTRFLAFATHYGFRPHACWPRRPQTKGKVERPFWYVETNLLNGRTFSSLEHLNQTTQVWLANTADVRIHRETRKRPIDAHAEEQSHLLKLPEQPLRHRQGRLSRGRCGRNDRLREQLLFDSLAVRWPDVAGADHRARVDRLRSGQLGTGGRHPLVPRRSRGERRTDAAHRPTRDSKEQEEVLRERFRELGEPALRFLEGLLRLIAMARARPARC